MNMEKQQLKIWTSNNFGESATARLAEGIPATDYQLVAGESDLASAVIAFGQPAVGSVMGSTTLRWIQLDSAGYERYDNEDFRAHVRRSGIVVTNSSSAYAQPCAEHTLAMIYGMARQLPGACAAQMSDHSWPMGELRAESRLLRGENVLLLGYGAIGRTIAALLAPLQMRLRGYRRRPDGTEAIPMIDSRELAAELALADHVINILPASPATNRFCNDALFSGMKRGAIFYNIGRGMTVDQEALVAALQSGQLGGAGLDVTDPEPLPADHPLWTAPNCLITPHTAGGQRFEKRVIVDHFLDNLRRFLAGEPLIDTIMS